MLELASPLLINFLGGFALNQNTGVASTGSRAAPLATTPRKLERQAPDGTHCAHVGPRRQSASIVQR